MTESLLINNLTQRLNPSIKNDYWIQFIEAVGQELFLQREQKLKKLSMYDIDSLTSEEIRDLAVDLLGYRIDISITDDLDFIKKIFKAIPWLIVNKTLYPSFDFIFKSVEKSGFIYLMYYSDLNQKLLRLMDMIEIYSKIDTYTDYTIPFVWFYPNRKATVNLINTTSTLDSALFEMDATPFDTLDVTSELLTKHLCLEYNISEYQEIDTKKYLFTKNYFDYLKYNGSYIRKTTDTIHYGCNITFPVDFRNGFSNYLPAIDTTIDVYDFYDQSLTNFVIKGIIEYDDGTEKEIGFVPVSSEEIFIYNEQLIILGLFKSRFSTSVFTGTFNLSDYTNTLDFENIVPVRTSGYILLSSSERIPIYDDGLGNILCDNKNISGVISYETSEFTIHFYKYISHALSVSSITPPISFSVGYVNLKPSSIQLRFTSNGVDYNIVDNGTGGFNVNILIGTIIHYDTGIIDFVCSHELTNVSMLFDSKHLFTTLNPVIEIWLNFMIEDNVKLKQINLYNDAYNTNHLLVTAKFPYIEMSDLDQHVSLQWILRAPAINLDMLDISKVFDTSPLLRVDRSR